MHISTFNKIYIETYTKISMSEVYVWNLLKLNILKTIKEKQIENKIDKYIAKLERV